MKRFYDLPYRSKLLITHLGIVLLTVLVIVTMVTIRTSRQAKENGIANLYLLTEQALNNFTVQVEAAERYLYTAGVSSGTSRQMAHMQDASGQSLLELVYTLSKMVDSRAPYDHVAVRLTDGTVVSCNTYNPAVKQSSESLLNDPFYAQKRYGEPLWVRTSTGEVYLLRDVYSTSPLQFAGKICARMRQEELISMTNRHAGEGYSIFFFDSDGKMILAVGNQSPDLEEGAAQLLETPTQTLAAQSGNYAACQIESRGWTAIGLLPMAAVEHLQFSMIQSGIWAALLGILMALLLSMAVSRQMSSQISLLVESMHRVEAGDWNVSIPVQSRDEIGVLTGQFNRMTEKTRSLLDKVVREETGKRQAEFMNLEYEYRFLQWQVNPHFIYNALETINALAKIDGNEELSGMIVMLSEYFRRNAEAVRKKFVTVAQEFDSLRQYADIYSGIYGEELHVQFDICDEVSEAYLPTMIIQPLLENALVHGANRPGSTTIHTSARAQGDLLEVRIEDNGAGMSQEMIERILGGQRSQSTGNRTSLGVRNVLDRLHLLYGDSASMSITAEIGRGTCVIVQLPLCFSETPLEKEWNL